MSINYYKELFDNTLEPILIMDGNNIIEGNMAALIFYELNSKDELKTIHPSQLSSKYQPDGQLSFEKANEMVNICYERNFHQFEWMCKTTRNKEFLAEVTLKVIYIDGKKYLHSTVRDLTKEKESKENLERKSRILQEKNKLINNVKNLMQTKDEENLIDNLNFLEEYKRALDESSIVSKCNIQGDITFVNKKFCERSGYSKEELIGSNHNIVKHPDMKNEFFLNLWKTISSKKVFKGVIKNLTKSRKTYYVDTTIIPILDKYNNIVEYISVRNDITKLYEKDKIIHRQNTDSLTGIPNRVSLLRDIENSINPILAIINIDSFKDINESYTFEVGDKVLIELAKYLKEYKETNISIYRVSNDVFAMLAVGNVDIKKVIDNCVQIIKRFKKKSLKIGNLDLGLTLTVGITKEKEKLLTHAEIAHLYAKQQNLAFAIFNEELPIYKELLKNIQITKDIKEAIKNNKILVYGQKIISNKNDSAKYETLMRLELENGDVLSPFVFLEQSKKAKLYPKLSKTIITKSCEYFENRDMDFSINLMLEDIRNKKTVKHLFDTLEKTNTKNHVTIEIVESEGIESYNEVEEFIKKVKGIGCKIAIDDFGTGYSNFEYLIKLDIDILKIDGSMIKNIHKDKNTYLTVKTIVNFAKILNIDIVAEFVHCEEVQKIIEELDIEYSQGYLFHKPEQLV